MAAHRGKQLTRHHAGRHGARDRGLAHNSYRVVGVKADGAVRVGADIAGAAWTVQFDQQVKGSNDGSYGLRMPLTDFYAFNGWTLHFFNTSRQGLRDRWLTLRCARGPVTLYGEAHRFRSDYGDVDFGRESDIGVTYVFNENIVARLQHARYDPGADTPDPSIRKTWLTISYTY